MTVDCTGTVASDERRRRNLNAAARQVAAAWGLTVLFRETYEPSSGRLVVVWKLAGTEGQRGFELELLCRPGLCSSDGWAGSVELRGPALEYLKGRLLATGTGGRATVELTRKRFCAWADTLVPNQFAKEKAANLGRLGGS